MRISFASGVRQKNRQKRMRERGYTQKIFERRNSESKREKC